MAAFSAHRWPCGRAFLQTTPRLYDIVAFSLLDAHRLSDANSNVRLDNFIYTRESIHSAANRLKPDGLLYLSFFPTSPAIFNRMTKTLYDEFGEQNVALFDMRNTFLGGTSNALIYTASRDLKGLRERVAASTNPSIRLLRERELKDVHIPPDTEELRDDWPYLHLSSPRIPSVYLLVYGLVVLLGAFVLRSNIRKIEPGWLTFLLFGMAFMLLETHIVTKSALLLGSTWVTFSYVTVGVLACVLLANHLVLSGRRPPEWVLYAALTVALLANYLIPLNAYLPLPFLLRISIFLIVATLPLLASGMLFSIYFDRYPKPDQALGVNILGALLGGMLESLSFVYGLKIVVLVALACYLAAAAMSRRGLSALPAPEGGIGGG